MVRKVRNVALSDIEEEIAPVEVEMVALTDGIQQVPAPSGRYAAARSNRPAAGHCDQGVGIHGKTIC
jgi:hypothetical protein